MAVWVAVILALDSWEDDTVVDIVFGSWEDDTVVDMVFGSWEDDTVVDMVFGSGMVDIIGELVVSATVVGSMFGSLGRIVQSTFDTVERVIMDLVVMLLTVLPEMIHTMS